MAFGVYLRHFASSRSSREAPGIDFPKRNIFRRCVQCDTPAPICPICAADEVCSLVGASCEVCAQSRCTKDVAGGAPPASNSLTQKGGQSATGAIAGGVVGGVVVIVIITCLVWRFCIKRKREEYEENKWRESGPVMEKDPDAFTVQRDARASTHTIGSIASTVLTRASNIIQIAYIPGVTNRSVESSPDLLVPPVPPIPAAPAAESNTSTPQPGQEQHFFMPSDLRDSRYSGYTEDGRTSFARSSTAPTMGRSSVATTAYQNNAMVNPLPAQVIARGKANAVSVKSSGKNSPIETPGSVTPPIPPIDFERHQIAPKSNSPNVARLGVPKAVTVINGSSNHPSSIHSSSGPSVGPLPSSSPSTSESSGARSVKIDRSASAQDLKRHNGDSSTLDDVSTDEEESPANRSLIGHNRRSQKKGWETGEMSTSRQSGFKSPISAPDLRNSHYKSLSSSSSFEHRLAPGNALKESHKRSGSLNQIIEEAARRASRDPRHGGLGSVGGWGGAGDGPGNTASWGKEGPFSDAHAAKTP